MREQAPWNILSILCNLNDAIVRHHEEHDPALFCSKINSAFIVLYWVCGAQEVQLIKWPARVIFAQTEHLHWRHCGPTGDLSFRLYQREISLSQGPVRTATLSDGVENTSLSPTRSFTCVQMCGKRQRRVPVALRHAGSMDAGPSVATNFCVTRRMEEASDPFSVGSEEVDSSSGLISYDPPHFKMAL